MDRQTLEQARQAAAAAGDSEAVAMIDEELARLNGTPEVAPASPASGIDAAQLQQALDAARAAGDQEAVDMITEALAAQQAPAAAQEPERPTTQADTFLGAVENAANFITAGAGDFLANVGRVAQATPMAYGSRWLANKFAGDTGVQWTDEEISKTPEDFKKFITYTPQTATGKKMKEALLGEVSSALSGTALEDGLNYISNATESFKNSVEAATGSRIMAEAAVAMPELLMDILPASMVGKAVKKSPVGALPNRKVLAGEVRDAFLETPDQIEKIKQLKNAAYDELKTTKAQLRLDTSAAVKQAIKDRLDMENIDLKAMGMENFVDNIIERFEPLKVVDKGKVKLQTPTIGTLDDIQKAIRQSYPANQASAAKTVMLKAVDDFMTDDLDRYLLGGKNGVDHETAVKMIKTARSLNTRLSRYGTLDEAFRRAAIDGPKEADTLVKEFRSILRNKKKADKFSPDERDAMAAIVQGRVDTPTGVLGLLGKIGATPVTILPAAARFARAFMNSEFRDLPIVTRAKYAARVLDKTDAKTMKAAQALQKQVLAGKTGTEIVTRYLKAVPKHKRSAAELGRLLEQSGKDLDAIELRGSKLEREAIAIARGRMAALGAAVGTAATTNAVGSATENEDENK